MQICRSVPSWICHIVACMGWVIQFSLIGKIYLFLFYLFLRYPIFVVGCFFFFFFSFLCLVAEMWRKNEKKIKIMNFRIYISSFEINTIIWINWDACLGFVHCWKNWNKKEKKSRIFHFYYFQLWKQRYLLY